jgi:hypothetical protein
MRDLTLVLTYSDAMYAALCGECGRVDTDYCPEDHTPGESVVATCSCGASQIVTVPVLLDVP